MKMAIVDNAARHIIELQVIFMQNSYILGAIVVVLAGALLWFGAQQLATNPWQYSRTEGPPSIVVGDNVTLGTDGDAEHGTYLIGYNGMPLYTTAKDSGATSTCYDECAANWIPYMVSPVDNLHAKAGVGGDIATTARRDSPKNVQVTYNGKPLYFYIGDKGQSPAGDGLGGVWSLARP